jgi:hypothetical protein
MPIKNTALETASIIRLNTIEVELTVIAYQQIGKQLQIILIADYKM